MTASTTSVPLTTLSDGVQIPQLGFGTFQVPPEDTAAAVSKALEIGYRHIDTAAAYGNEAAVAEAIHAACLKRDEVFVTTKCFNDSHGYDAARQALSGSLRRLGFDQIDLYLIHWPVPSQDLYVETWRAFIDAQREGLARSIGVSNFQPAHLHRIVEETGVVPSVNQIELHPHLQQPELRALHESMNIATEAWSPLARGRVLDEPAIVAIARAHGRTPGQVVLRWHLQLGNIVFPKSVTPARIAENFRLFDFELSDEEMQRIGALDRSERIGADPDTFVRPGPDASTR